MPYSETIYYNEDLFYFIPVFISTHCIWITHQKFHKMDHIFSAFEVTFIFTATFKKWLLSNVEKIVGFKVLFPCVFWSISSLFSCQNIDIIIVNKSQNLCMIKHFINQTLCNDLNKKEIMHKNASKAEKTQEKSDECLNVNHEIEEITIAIYDDFKQKQISSPIVCFDYAKSSWEIIKWCMLSSHVDYNVWIHTW